MNKDFYQIISILIITMFIIPALLVNLQNPQDVMGLFMLLFFIVNPIVSIIIGIISGKSIKKLWYFPVLLAIVFPMLYWIILQDIVFDLYIYSIGYLILGIISMLITSLIVNKGKK